MQKLSKRFAKIKADEICQDLRDAGGTYYKRYSEIRSNPPAMRVKLFAIDCGFTRENEGIGLIIKYFERRKIKYKFIGINRSSYSPDGFVFWLPLKNL